MLQRFFMALNIKNAEVERLAAEVARITGETKAEAIRRVGGAQGATDTAMRKESEVEVL